MQFKDGVDEILQSPLEIQRETVARVAKSPQEERERSIVEGNRELIRIYEEKVKQAWEGVK